MDLPGINKIDNFLLEVYFPAIRMLAVDIVYKTEI